MQMRVPNLVELLARLRDTRLRYPITIVHALHDGEGEWVLANAAARLSRENVRAVGPEPATPAALVDHAARLGVKVVLLGEMRRQEDARALRNAATLSIHPVAVITAPMLAKAQDLLILLGPWEKYDLKLLSHQSRRTPPPPGR